MMRRCNNSEDLQNEQILSNEMSEYTAAVNISDELADPNCSTEINKTQEGNPKTNPIDNPENDSGKNNPNDNPKENPDGYADENSDVNSDENSDEYSDEYSDECFDENSGENSDENPDENPDENYAENYGENSDGNVAGCIQKPIIRVEIQQPDESHSELMNAGSILDMSHLYAVTACIPTPSPTFSLIITPSLTPVPPTPLPSPSVSPISGEFLESVKPTYPISNTTLEIALANLLDSENSKTSAEMLQQKTQQNNLLLQANRDLNAQNTKIAIENENLRREVQNMRKFRMFVEQKLKLLKPYEFEQYIEYFNANAHSFEDHRFYYDTGPSTSSGAVGAGTSFGLCAGNSVDFSAGYSAGYNVATCIYLNMSMNTSAGSNNNTDSNITVFTIGADDNTDFKTNTVSNTGSDINMADNSKTNNKANRQTE